MSFSQFFSQFAVKEILFQGHQPLVIQPITIHKETTFVKATSYKTPGEALQKAAEAEPVTLAPGEVWRHWMHMDRAFLHPQSQRMLAQKDPVLFLGSNGSVLTNGSV